MGLKEKILHNGGVLCNSCHELIPEHELLYTEMLNMDEDDIECISCEMKYRDSADLDMFGGWYLHPIKNMDSNCSNCKYRDNFKCGHHEIKENT